MNSVARWVLFLGLPAVLHAQQPPWNWHGPRPLPELLDATAYDPARQRIVAIDAPNQFHRSFFPSPRPQAWEWAAGRWHQRATANVPPRRVGARMAYDYVNGAVLMFGGWRYDPATGLPFNFNDTWLWDGRTWQQVAMTGAVPSARYGHGLASDPVRRRIVLHGGGNGYTPTFDPTWEWDGTQWLSMNPPITPAAMFGHGLAYDALSGRIAAAGGQSQFSVQAALWFWDGQNWIGGGADVGRHDLQLFTDPVGGGLIMYGGRDNQGNSVPDVRRWNGQGWQVLGTHPDNLAHEVAQVDMARRRLVFPWTGRRDAWELDLASGAWIRIATGILPLNGGLGTMRPSSIAFASWRDAFLVVEHDSNLNGRTWWVDDTGWHLAAMHNGGGGFLSACENMGVVLGIGAGFLMFDGSVWHTLPRPDAGSPAPFRSTEWTIAGYYPQLGKMLVVQAGPIRVHGWDPISNWTLLEPNGPASVYPGYPVGRATIDRDRNRLVYVETGGSSGPNTLFEWDGTSWTSTVLPLIYTDAIEFVPGLGCVISAAHPSSPQFQDNWVWDGAMVTPLVTQTLRPRDRVVSAAWDPNHQRLRLLTWRPEAMSWEFWDLRREGLTANSLEPAPGSQVTFSLNAPSHAGEFWITAMSTVAGPGIPLYPLSPFGTRTLALGHDPLLSLSLHWGIHGVLDPQGRGQASLSVPPIQGLDGLVVHAQAISLAPHGFGHVSNPLRFDVTR